jgi:hypothetical protein
MKYILSLIIGGALVVSGFGQTRNVLVGTNNAVVQPTNFWSADASNARTGLGLGWSALTNTDATNFRNAIGLGEINDGIFATLRSTQVASSSIFSLTLGQTNTGFGGVGAGPSDFGYYRNGSVVWYVSSTNLTIVNGVGFGTTAAAAITRTNLGLGATNNVAFGNITFGSLSISNSIISISATNNQSVTFSYIGAPLFSVGAQGASFGVPVSFGSVAATRTNLGLPWSGLTNVNAADFQAALFGSNTNPVLVNTNGDVVSPTNFWAAAPISTTVQYQTNVTGTSTNSATNSRNLFLFSLSPSVSGITNTVTLPTNPATTFEGDRATITHLAQTTSAVTAIRQLGAATNLITLNQLDEAVLLIYRSGAWILADNISYVEPIFFSGTNAAANAAASRTNLSLGATWLTNTNVTNFRTAIGLGSTNSVTFGAVLSGAANASFTASSNGGVALGWQGTPDRVTIDSALSLNAPTLALSFGTNNSTGAAITRTNLGLGATWLTNTNATNFRTAIGLGSSNSVTFASAVVGSTESEYSQLTPSYISSPPFGFEINFEENFIAAEGGSFQIRTVELQLLSPIAFVGTNAAADVAITRTNLGLPLPALTNTNNANFRNAIELGTTNNVSFSNVTASGTLTATSTLTAKTNLVVDGFVDFSTNHTNSNPATNNQINDFIEIRVGTNQFWLPVYK